MPAPTKLMPRRALGAADVPAAQGAALHHALAQQNKLATTVLWPYADKLAVFGGDHLFKVR